jgi:hypothetical protein
MEEETFNYDYDDDESLNMFLFFIVKKLDVSAKRHFLAMFLEAMGINNQRDPLDSSTRYVRIRLSEECKYRAKELLEHVEMIFFHILPARQEELYQYCLRLRDMLDYDMTGKGYIEFLNTCNHLVRLTGLPFSLEEEYGGLKTWEAWDNAIENAVEDCKTRFGRGRKKSKRK